VSGAGPPHRAAASRPRLGRHTPRRCARSVRRQRRHADGGRQRLAKQSAAGRVGTTDEVATAAAYLLNAGFVTGSDLLIDGGVIAAMNAGRLQFGG